MVATENEISLQTSFTAAPIEAGENGMKTTDSMSVRSALAHPLDAEAAQRERKDIMNKKTMKLTALSEVQLGVAEHITTKMTVALVEEGVCLPLDLDN